jgi:hypothetical protein
MIRPGECVRHEGETWVVSYVVKPHARLPLGGCGLARNGEMIWLESLEYLEKVEGRARYIEISQHVCFTEFDPYGVAFYRNVPHTYEEAQEWAEKSTFRMFFVDVPKWSLGSGCYEFTPEGLKLVGADWDSSG